MNPFERKSYRLSTSVLLAVALHAAGARASESDAPMFSFSGFGTFGAVRSSESKADFTSNTLKPNGAGHSRAWSLDVDSRIGAQITANFSRRVSAVVQVVSEQRYDNTYTPTIEWANIKYQVTPDFSVRAGRIVQQAFLVSDSRKVGYTNPWVRPPVEVYNLVPISNSDGVDATYRVHVGDVTNTVQGTYGRTEPEFPNGAGRVTAKDLWSLTYAATQGPATVHVTYLKSKLTIGSLQPLFDGFRQFGPEGIALADKYEIDNKPFAFVGLGAMYDPGGWFVMAELGAGNSRAAIGKRTAWYVSGGYRLGNFTPYLTYAQAKLDSNSSDPGLTLAALPSFLAGPAAGLNAGLNTILGASPLQKTLAAGGRWDFTKNAALKVQFDHTRLGAGSAGTLINVQPGFQPGGSFNVFSATIDFVF